MGLLGPRWTPGPIVRVESSQKISDLLKIGVLGISQMINLLFIGKAELKSAQQTNFLSNSCIMNLYYEQNCTAGENFCVLPTVLFRDQNYITTRLYSIVCNNIQVMTNIFWAKVG